MYLFVLHKGKSVQYSSVSRVYSIEHEFSGKFIGVRILNISKAK